MSTDVAAWLASDEGREWSERMFLRPGAVGVTGSKWMRGPVDPAHDPTGRPPIRRQV